LTSPSSQTSPNAPTSPANSSGPVDQAAQDAAAGQPTCGRCSGHNLRRSHSRSRLQKLVRRFSSWDRYACRSCGHRGWARGKVAPRAERLAAAESALRRGRKAETRDHRLKRKVRLRAFLVVGVSLGLGILAALFLQRCGVSPPAE
jgi:hypothetical protein